MVNVCVYLCVYPKMYVHFIFVGAVVAIVVVVAYIAIVWLLTEVCFSCNMGNNIEFVCLRQSELSYRRPYTCVCVLVFC